MAGCSPADHLLLIMSSTPPYTTAAPETGRQTSEWEGPPAEAGVGGI